MGELLVVARGGLGVANPTLLHSNKKASSSRALFDKPDPSQITVAVYFLILLPTRDIIRFVALLAYPAPGAS
jgi:hypothetical protein